MVKVETPPALNPPLPDLQWQVRRIVAETVDLPLEKVQLASRMVEDLGIDSLDVVEVILALEETFGVTLSEERLPRSFFTENATVDALVEAVALNWGTGQSARPEWYKREGNEPEPDATVEETMFTQLGGKVKAKEHRDGPLYEPLGRNREGYEQFLRRTDGMRCVLIPSAEVEIGSDDPDLPSDSHPLHRVQLSAFLMDAEPVSNLAYARFLNSFSPYKEILDMFVEPVGERRRGAFGLRKARGGWQPVSGADRQPVILVSWFGANAYALWAHRGDVHGDWGGENAARCRHLPSEAQWEYASRGATYRAYPWGDTEARPEMVRVAQHRAGTRYAAEELPAARVSERLGMSPFGLHHMAGNVWQWCRDWYAPDFYARPEATFPDAMNATPPRYRADGYPIGIRSERGGSWVGPGSLARSSYRRGREPYARGRCLGFRCIGDPAALPDHR